MTITQIVEIPDNHRLIIDVPCEVPAGPVILTFTLAGKPKEPAKGPFKTADAFDKRYVTQKLNEVYDDDYYKEFEPISNAALESIRESTRSDTW